MQLKLQRSQRAGGVLGTTVIFCLDARADYSPAEGANIGKYRLGGQIVYNSQAAKRHLEAMDRHLSRVDSDRFRDQTAGLLRGVASLALAKMNLNISIASLGRGHHIECKDLPELLDAEKTLMEACRGLKQFLEAAATFNGSIILVDFDDGEKVHVSQGALELATLPPPSTAASSPTGNDPNTHDPLERLLEDLGRKLGAVYRDNPKASPIAASILGGVFILAIFGLGFWSLCAAALLVAGTTIRTL